MQIQKRNDGLSLRNLLQILASCDAEQCGMLDMETFAAGLKKYNLFPSVVELQSLMRVYQKGGSEKNRLIDYVAFVNALRVPLEGRR